jgi:Glycosyl transferase family 2
MDSEHGWPHRADRLPNVVPGLRRAEGGLRLREDAGKRPSPQVPMVSYVTVVRNGAATLARTLQSVREQRWPNVEHIVLDGLSSDGTLELIQAHAGQIDYYASEPDQGLYDALNKAIALAHGELICVLNADDWLTPDAAELAVRAHQAAGSPAAHLVLTAAWLMKESGKRLWLPGPLDLSTYLRCANICHNGVYATPQAYRASGPYATDLKIAADFCWLVATVDAGVPAAAIDEPTVHYTLGGLSSNALQHTQDCARVLGQRFAFLDTAEVWGLLHAFHCFRGNMAPFVATRPPHLGRFLATLAHTHARQGDFMAALAQACTFALQHPEDRRAAGQLSTHEKLGRGWRKLRMHLRDFSSRHAR